MTKLKYTRAEIGELAERMEVRGYSRLLKDRPELQNDLRAVALILRKALESGFPVSALEIELITNGSNGK